MMRETWYVLEDGGVVDPAEVSTRADGRLAHESGQLVAMRGDVPSSRSVDPEAMRAAYKTRDMQPEPRGKGYRTRKV
jgi:hypothetical protein